MRVDTKQIRPSAHWSLKPFKLQKKIFHSEKFRLRARRNGNFQTERNWLTRVPCNRAQAFIAARKSWFSRLRSTTVQAERQCLTGVPFRRLKRGETLLPDRPSLFAWTRKPKGVTHADSPLARLTLQGSGEHLPKGVDNRTDGFVSSVVVFVSV